MEATTPAAAKVGGNPKGICLKASMSSSKRRGDESARLADGILELEDVDGVEEESQPARLRSLSMWANVLVP